MKYRALISDLISNYEAIISKLNLLDSNQKFIRKLLQDNFQILTVYDIGAYKGVWTKRLKYILPKSNFFLFEANPVHGPDLRKIGAPYFLEVLSNSEQSREWWTIDGTGDSLFRENQSCYSNLEPVVKVTRTLDSLVSEFKLPLPDLIKIDVQGAELEVMKGASMTLDHASIIILELPIIEYNIGAPKITEYLDFMKNIGFLPLDLLEVHKANEILVQVDIGFAKKEIIVRNYKNTGKLFI
jgi:FkbM family methyltransferase